MSLATLNQKVDNFTLPATGDKEISLNQFSGSWVVIYFYPKDNTPGCTTEGQDFSELNAQFKQHNCIILGVSRDSIKKHENFKTKYNFTFDLLADTEETLCQQFDVIKQKKLYGREYMGIERSTFLIDKTGVLIKEWRKVRVKGHAEEVLETIKAFSK